MANIISANRNYRPVVLQNRVNLLNKLISDISNKNTSPGSGTGRQEISTADRERLQRVSNSTVVYRRV